MGTINSNKIATRTWSNSTMGSAAKLSYSSGNDCLTYSDINQDSSAYIIAPVSSANGALPSSYLSNSVKCLKQSDLDRYYNNKYLFVDTIIKYNTAATTSTAYQIEIKCNYGNSLYTNNNTSYPINTGILEDLTANVTINCHNKNPIGGMGSLRASTDCSCLLTAQPNNTEEKIEGICLSKNNGLVSNLNPSTGTLTNTVFLSYYLEDMYNYCNGEDSSYVYKLVTNITPEYGISYNSPLEAQKYVPIINDVVTTTTSNNISARIVYNCVSGPDFMTLNALNTWQYTITISSITPTVTSSPASSIDITVDKGSITRSNSWNSTTKTLTISGKVTYTPTTETSLPIVKFTYIKSNYTTLIRNFLVNVKYGMAF